MNLLRSTSRLAIICGLSLLFFIAFVVFFWPGLTVQALDSIQVYYVAPSCAGVPVPCFTSIQAAVDAVDEPINIIKVAAGTYTDVHARPRSDIATTGVVTQVAYISKTITIQGGYTPTNWATPNPTTNPTTLDAQGRGRVVYLTGNISATIRGVRLTGGNSTGLGGRPGGYDSGGGVYAISATMTFDGNRVSDNLAFSGGGMWLYQSQGIVTNNEFAFNTANYCGGLRLQNSPIVVSTNTILSNTAISGGGLCLASSDQAAALHNTISGNTATQDGGGILVSYSMVVLENNLISNNVANQGGGGLRLDYSAAEIRANTVWNNHANQNGGGLFLNYSGNVTLVNTVLAANTAIYGGGAYLLRSELRSFHTTIANNQPTGIYATGEYECDLGCEAWPSVVATTNTILAGQMVGVYADSVSGINLSLAEINLKETLWYSNTQDWSGGGTIITGTHNYWNNPVFIDAAGGNYHLHSTSAAIDRGVDVGVYRDMDNDPRPAEFGFDLGADEYRAAALALHGMAWQPRLNLGQVTTLTLAVSNVGIGTTTHLLLTNTLPMEFQALAIAITQGTCFLGAPGISTVACDLGILTPGAVAQLTLTVRVTNTRPAYLPWAIHNVAQVTALEAVSNLTAMDWLLIDCRARLNDEPAEYAGIQAAVDTARNGDVIKVSGTSCSDVHTYGELSQVVYLSKTLTLRGGYSTAFIEPPDPVSYPTTLDALGQGRVIYIANGARPVIEGLQLTGGQNLQTGGGLYVSDSTPTIRNCQVFSNSAAAGGGMFLINSVGYLAGNTIFSNTAQSGAGLSLVNSVAALTTNEITGNTATTGIGGGLDLSASAVTLFQDRVVANTAFSGGGIALSNHSAISLSTSAILSNVVQGDGGGIFSTWDLPETACTSYLENNLIAGNTAGGNGGGLHLTSGAVTLRHNMLSNNTAGWSGGGALLGGTATLYENVISHNSAGQVGGGLTLVGEFALGNNMIVDNQVGVNGSGIYLEDATIWAEHTTLARNTGGDGSGLYIGDEPGPYFVTLTNTIVASQTVGITAKYSGTHIVRLDGTLWSGNGTNWGYPGIIVTAVHNYYGDPVFANPEANDYHITSGSAAIDRGVPASVITDIDNQPRFGVPDLGADEYWGPGALKQILLPIVFRP